MKYKGYDKFGDFSKKKDSTNNDANSLLFGGKRQLSLAKVICELKNSYNYVNFKTIVNYINLPEEED